MIPYEETSEFEVEGGGFHFGGYSEVTRGEWKMRVPVDFHIFLSEDADTDLLENAALVCSKAFVTRYVDESDKAHGVFSTIDEDEDY